ncbi:MAG: TlpA family protein disulfide reductase [Planctomycetia bacterium]|nr:TlpA family protein disulfide reductase [Planctomycetia bacterium]
MKRHTLAIGLFLASASLLARTARADEAEDVKKIQELAQGQKLAEAEEAFQAALKEFPDSPRVRSLHMQLYSANFRVRKFAEGAEHAVAYLDFQLEQFAKNPQTAPAVVGAASMAANALQMSGKGDLGLEKIDKAIEALEAGGKDSPSPQLELALGNLRTNKINLMLNTGKAAEAGKLLQTELAAANKAYDEAPGEVQRAIRLANLLQFEVNVAARTAPDTASPLRTKLAAFVGAEIKKHPDSLPLISTYNAAAMQSISEVMSSDAIEAEKRLGDWKAFLADLDTSIPNVKNLVEASNRNMASMERTIAAGRKRQELVGKPAIPLDVQDWVNGAALSEGDLKGKVVLLDFWAVWCGPCIATFPHLRGWNEKFGDKGLVIVGVTRYYQYDWDEDGNRPKKVKDLSTELEQAAMVKFAEHHQLKHRFAVTPNDSGFHDAYGVTGIPQAVLIDRTGAVRMIRVGSGDKNAHDLGKLLEELIGDTSTSAEKGK